MNSNDKCNSRSCLKSLFLLWFVSDLVRSLWWLSKVFKKDVKEIVAIFTVYTKMVETFFKISFFSLFSVP